ncbi:fruit body lectin [Agrocybe pediades]|nr:fruit body lectin [Agrocybe pediades]
MSYTLTLRTYQTDPTAFFAVVEQSAWVNAAWSDTDGVKKLSITGSGTSGGLRFQCPDTKETFAVYVGVHNFKRWCDIVVDTAENTVTTLFPEYYKGGTPQDAALWRQAASFSATNSRGRKISINFSVADGNNLVANIVIG